MPVFHKPENAPDELTQLMLTAVPENERGYKTLSHLAKLMGVTKWAQRKWITAQELPAKRAMQIVEISEGRVDIRQLDKFVYKT